MKIYEDLSLAVRVRLSQHSFRIQETGCLMLTDVTTGGPTGSTNGDAINKSVFKGRRAMP